MKIISKTKDYYDWLVGVYGEDPLLTYDRRGGEESIFNILKNPTINLYSKYLCDRGRCPTDWILIGNKVWEFYANYEEDSVTGINKVNWEWGRDINEILKDYYHNSPLYEGYMDGDIINRDRWIEYRLMNRIRYGKLISEFITDKDKLAPVILLLGGNIYINPILKDTPIPSYIPAETIWITIQDYLGSLKDVKFEDSRSDIQKLESAGFDKKESFRGKVNNGCKKAKRDRKRND